MLTNDVTEREQEDEHRQHYPPERLFKEIRAAKRIEDNSIDSEGNLAEILNLLAWVPLKSHDPNDELETSQDQEVNHDYLVSGFGSARIKASEDEEEGEE